MPQITLPWPPAELFPNKANRRTGHWGYAKKAKVLRQLAWGLTLEQIGADKLRNWPASEITLRYRFKPPMRRGKVADEDGVMAALKAARDGISDALGVDDRHFRSEKPEWLPRKGDGEIEISF
jgi:crossover junction endodeoxyribonuclease RusA